MEINAEIKQVIEYIDAHLTEEISISTLSEIVGFSKWHLCHVFRDCIGMPVMEYIRLQRLRHAVNELAHERRLYDIALDYGFETQAGFYKAFQRHFGCSPTRYRIHKQREINRQIDPVLVDVANGGLNMQDRTTIRIVQTEDAQDLWENVYSRNTLNEVEDRVAGNLWAYSEDKALPLVAEVDGHVIATMYIAFDEHPLRSHICTLHDVVVNPGFQRMGIARSLFEECKALAAKNGKNTICISVRGGTTAETVYRKLGFTEYGRLPNGITESWGEHSTFDEVFFYMPLN